MAKKKKKSPPKKRNVFVETIIERGGHSVMPNKKKQADKEACRKKINSEENQS